MNIANWRQIAELIGIGAIVEAVQTHFSHVHIRWRQIGPVDPSVAARRFAYALYIFPGLRNARDRQLAILESGNISLAGTFTSSGFENQVNQFLRVYDEEGEQIPEDQEYVFW